MDLEDEGFEVVIAKNPSKAIDLMKNSEFDIIIIDIMMPPGDNPYFKKETKKGFDSGLLLARWIKMHYPHIPIIAHSKIRSSEVVDWFNKNGYIFLDKQDDLIQEAKYVLSGKDRLQKLKTFIVHGHDEILKYQLKNYLQNILGLSEPIILHEQPSLGRTIIEKFEELTIQIDLVFVLLTPDDKMSDSSVSDDIKRRARQNVIFEMGYFFGKLQRRTGRVILLYKGTLDLPSDISGVVYIDVTNGIEAAGESIRKELLPILKS
jgi:CheY-like chemotaxis protein